MFIYASKMKLEGLEGLEGSTMTMRQLFDHFRDTYVVRRCGEAVPRGSCALPRGSCTMPRGYIYAMAWVP